MAELYKSVTELMKTARGNKALQGNLGDITDFQQIIDDTPTAEVVEVKHGEWREGALLKVCREIKHYPTVICSDCGITFCDIINNHNYMYRYCPNCGAKMDGERKDK